MRLIIDEASVLGEELAEVRHRAKQKKYSYSTASTALRAAGFPDDTVLLTRDAQLARRFIPCLQPFLITPTFVASPDLEGVAQVSDWRTAFDYMDAWTQEDSKEVGTW